MGKKVYVRVIKKCYVPQYNIQLIDQNMALKNVSKKHTGYSKRYLSTKICLYDLGRFLNTWVNHLCLLFNST